MNYKKLYYKLVDSLDFNECNIRKTKVIFKVKNKANMAPMNLSEKISNRNIVMRD